MGRTRQEHGFTFPELLVVMLIIGILVAIAIPLLLPKKNRASDASAKTNVRSVVAHVEACFTETDDYRRCAPGEEPGIEDIGLVHGNVPGGFEVTPTGRKAYRVDAFSNSGIVFSLRREQGADPERLCEVPAGADDRGGCSARPTGSW
jgi:prepilin-type N-terminal cleavage/methylation domain-containing protein